MPVYCDLKAMTETLLFEEPAASAVIRGNEEHPDIYGTALLYSFCGGTLLAVQAGPVTWTVMRWWTLTPST